MLFGEHRFHAVFIRQSSGRKDSEENEYLPRVAYIIIYTHILTITYANTHNNTQM